jgi:hypothetical protein
MNKARFGGALALALTLLAGTAAAQAVIDLTPEEEDTIYTTITRETVGAAPRAESDWHARVGIEVPARVELYEVPTAVQVAPVREYRYTIINDDVVLVDPGTRRVVRVIER